MKTKAEELAAKFEVSVTTAQRWLNGNIYAHPSIKHRIEEWIYQRTKPEKLERD